MTETRHTSPSFRRHGLMKPKDDSQFVRKGIAGLLLGRGGSAHIFFDHLLSGEEWPDFPKVRESLGK